MIGAAETVERLRGNLPTESQARATMRLLVIGHSFLQAVAQRKYAAMKRRRHGLEIRVLTIQELPHLFKTFRLEVNPALGIDGAVALPTVRRFSSHMTYLFWPRQFEACIRSFAPDVIHLEEEPHSFIAAETVALARRAAPRAAITMFTWDNLNRERAFPLGYAKEMLRRYTLGRCALVVCGNREARDLLHQHRRYRGPSVVLPQSDIDPADHCPGTEESLRKSLGIEASVCVGFLGRLVPEKGLRLLLSALWSLRELPWKLLVVGNGPLAEELRGSQDRLPGRIVHVPAVPPEETPRYFRCLDVFVLPSYAIANWKEQFGLAMAQAMMVGKPCVGSSSGAIPEVLGPGGLIFEEGSSAALTEALRRLLCSAESRAELGARAREFALQHYASDVVADRYLEAFDQAVERHRQVYEPLPADNG